jgi:hypothetical protein
VGAARGGDKGSAPIATHESFVSYRAVRTSSDRAFGLTFTLFFAIVALWPPAFSGNPPRLWAFALAAAFFLAACFRPDALARLNRLWTRLGFALHRITTPVIMGAMYFGTIVPAGLLMRLFGKDPLRLKPMPKSESYWIRREPNAPERGSMSRQF